MADHSKIFNQGVEAWNKWREENPELTPDLAGEQFSYENLSGINFSRMDLSYEDLSSATLIGADFTRAELDHTDLSDAYLKGAKFVDGNLSCVNLYGAFLEGANFKGANLGEGSLKETSLENAILDGAILWRAYLLDARGLSVAQLMKAESLHEVIDLDEELLKAIKKSGPQLFEGT